MLSIYILAILIHAVLSSTPCKDGVEIISKKTNNPEDIIGNWTYVYHWDNVNKFNMEFDYETDHSTNCPEMSITAVTPDFVKEKEAECANKAEPFKWSDGKFRLDAPLLNMEGVIFFIGEKDNWMMADCNNILRVVIKKVSDDYMVLIHPDVANATDMFAKKIPTLDELKCIAHNVDVGKGMSGYGLCY